jgi:hypothetical protein
MEFSARAEMSALGVGDGVVHFGAFRGELPGVGLPTRIVPFTAVVDQAEAR